MIRLSHEGTGKIDILFKRELVLSFYVFLKSEHMPRLINTSVKIDLLETIDRGLGESTPLKRKTTIYKRSAVKPVP